MAKYEELPSSSSCLLTLSRSMLKHEKAVEAKHQSKYWVKYNQEKAMKRFACDQLIAVLATQDALGDDAGMDGFDTSRAGLMPKKWQLNSRNHRAERTRRKVRLSAAAARCYFEPDDATLAEPVPTPVTPETNTPAFLVRSPSKKSTTTDSAWLVAGGDGLKTEAKSVEKSKKGHRASGGKNCSVM